MTQLCDGEAMNVQLKLITCMQRQHFAVILLQYGPAVQLTSPKLEVL